MNSLDHAKATALLIALRAMVATLRAVKALYTQEGHAAFLAVAGDFNLPPERVHWDPKPRPGPDRIFVNFGDGVDGYYEISPCGVLPFKLDPEAWEPVNLTMD